MANRLTRFAAAAFATLGLVTSVLLIPRDYERAMQEIEAGELKQAILRLQGLQARGDTSPPVAAALAFAEAEQGDLPAALLSLEAIARARPQDTSVLTALADLYLGAGRMAQHVEILERQQAIAPEAKRLGQIAALHEELGQVDRQRAALWTLVHDYETARDRYLDLARLEAADGEPRKAIEVLDLQRKAHPNAVNADSISLALALELTLHEDEQALARSRDWLDRQAVPEKAIETLADVFQTQRRPDLLVALAAPLAEEGAPLAVLEALAEAYQRSGDRQGANDILERLRALSGSRPQVVQARLRIAYAISDSEQMLAAAHQLPIEAIPAFMMKGVVTAAVTRRDADYLRSIDGTAREQLFRRDPVLAANASIVLGELDDARAWIEIARTERGTIPADLLGAAQVDFQLARSTRSLQTLRELFGEAPSVAAAPTAEISSGAAGSARETIPRDGLAAAAGLYVSLDVPEEGREVLGAYRQAFPSVEADRAWALVAAASSRSGEVRQWQADLSDDQALPPEFLDQLASTAMTAGAFDLAASAASRLVAERGSDADKMLMAQALVSSSRPLYAAVATVP